MLHIHPNALTALVNRAKIARSDEPSSVLARHQGVNTQTVLSRQLTLRAFGAMATIARCHKQRRACSNRPVAFRHEIWRK